MKIKIILVSIVALIILIIGGFFLHNYSKTKQVKSSLELGNKYLLEQKYEEAVIAYNNIIKIEPKNLEARIGLAKAYIGMNKINDAEVVLKDALSISKKDPNVYLELANLYLRLDRGKDALEILKTGYEETKSPEIKKLLDKLMAQPGAPEASIAAGNYDFAQDVVLKADGEVEIYYTLDNTMPTTGSKKYNGPISIGSGKTVLRVIAVSKTGVASKENVYEYNIQIKPLNENDWKLSKIEVGMIMPKVIEILGNPQSRRSEFDEYYGTEFDILDYPVGSFWFDKADSKLRNFEIRSNDITVGYRNIKIGDSVESLINKYPHVSEIKPPSTTLYEIDEPERGSAMGNIGIVTYDENNKINSVQFGIGPKESEYALILRYVIADGKVKAIQYFVY